MRMCVNAEVVFIPHLHKNKLSSSPSHPQNTHLRATAVKNSCVHVSHTHDMNAE